MSLARGVWRPGNFLTLSDLPQITYGILARVQSIWSFFSCLSKNCLFHCSKNSFTRCSCPEIPRYQTNRSVLLNPIFHSTTRIAQYSETRNTKALEEQISVLDCDISRYEKFHSAFLIPTIYCFFFGKPPNSLDNFAPCYQCILPQKYLVP